uniref:GG17098 n=1 Tax=Drosophila erecta TaxID=7220 RepID=B3P466_DROER
MLPCDNMLGLLHGCLTDWAHRFFFGERRHAHDISDGVLSCIFFMLCPRASSFCRSAAPALPLPESESEC